MTQILVLQWSASTESDYEALIKMEDALISGLDETHDVDGHDFGSGEMNIFIVTERAQQAFEAVRAILGDRPQWASVRAAFRDEAMETYDVLWPAGLTDFDVI